MFKDEQQTSNGVSKSLLTAKQQNNNNNNEQIKSNGLSNGNHTNGDSTSTIEKLQQIISGLQDELHLLKDLVKKHERRIIKLESEKNEIEVDCNSDN